MLKYIFIKSIFSVDDENLKNFSFQAFKQKLWRVYESSRIFILLPYVINHGCLLKFQIGKLCTEIYYFKQALSCFWLKNHVVFTCCENFEYDDFRSNNARLKAR